MIHSKNLILEKLDKLIEMNIDNSDFPIETICKEIGVSRTQLHRTIKEVTQLSTTIYIRKIRLQKAKILLETTNQRVSEIADAVGINNATNFSKYFFAEFGISPTDYRKQSLANEKEIEVLADFFDEEKIEISTLKKSTFSSLFIYIFIGFLAVLGIGSYLYFGKKNNKVDENSEQLAVINDNSIAILPFKNLGDSSKSYLSEGIMSQIHNSLASLSDLKIISTSSSNKFENTQKPTKQISQELNVKYLLFGTVLQVENEVRITIQLVKAADDIVVWSNTFEGETKNIFSYMKTVSKDVAEELNQKLNSNFTNKINKIPTKNLEAYNLNLQGQKLMQTRIGDKIKASIIKFESAIKLDPSFADAFTNLSLAYYLMAEDFYMDVPTAYKLSEKNALTAIRLDTENGRAYANLGNIYKAQNKWEQALTTYQIALKFSPNDAQINYWYSLTLRSIGQLHKAIQYSTKAVSLDPLASNIVGGHIINCAYAGEFELAEKGIKEGELIFNDAPNFHNAKAFYFITKKSYEAALKELLICKKIHGKLIHFESSIAYTNAKLGNTEEAKKYLKSMEKTPENYIYFAIVYAGLGDKENTLKYLELAAEIDSSPNYLKISPMFTFLHNEPRFNAVLNKLGLMNPAFLAE